MKAKIISVMLLLLAYISTVSSAGIIKISPEDTANENDGIYTLIVEDSRCKQSVLTVRAAASVDILVLIDDVAITSYWDTCYILLLVDTESYTFYKLHKMKGGEWTILSG